ncbi:MAG: tRNA pseudouridine(55) synthase TruB [Planctomycetota bacterium]
MAAGKNTGARGRPFGFLNVDKPPKRTSHQAVAAVRRNVPDGTKVGHAGTLDPLATGVLVICVGPATRLGEHVQRRPKRYRAEITLGATSTTDDLEGTVTPTPDARPADAGRARAVLGRFVGEIEQTPPAHSAVHVEGSRAYRLARRGERPDLPARPVAIHHIEPLRYEWPILEIDVRCSAGTYIRSLARDVGAAVGVGGYCSALTRTEVGPFTLGDAVALDEVEPARDLIEPTVALADMARAELADDLVERIATGQTVRPGGSLPEPGKPVAMVDRLGRLAALGHVEPDGRSVQPDKVFVAAPGRPP